MTTPNPKRAELRKLTLTTVAFLLGYKASEVHQDSVAAQSVDEIMDAVELYTAELVREARLNEIEWAVAYAQSDLGADFVDKGRDRIAALQPKGQVKP